MAKQLKLRRRQSKPLPYIGMQIPEKKGFLSSLGVLILFGGQEEYVCGDCYQLLKSLDLRYLLHSPFKVVPQMYYTLPILSLSSKGGCEFHFLTQNPSLFPKSLLKDESIFMGCYLECHKNGVMLKKVNVPYQSEEKEKKESLLTCGQAVSLICSKLTVLQSWDITSQNM